MRLGLLQIVKKLQKTEQEYELFTKDYRDLHFNVRKIEKKIRKIDQKIKKTKAEIRNLDDDNLSNKNKLELNNILLKQNLLDKKYRRLYLQKNLF